MFVFERKCISKYKKFAFSGLTSLRKISELLKNVPGLLKRME